MDDHTQTLVYGDESSEPSYMESMARELDEMVTGHGTKAKFQDLNI